MFEEAYVYLHLARTGVTFPGMPPSVLPPWREAGVWEVSNYFNCSITQFNARRNGGFDFNFYKPSRKAFVFPLNTRMTDSRALSIPGRASRALRVTKPQAMHHSGRGRGQPPVPEDGQTRCKATDCSCCPHPSRIWGF